MISHLSDSLQITLELRKFAVGDQCRGTVRWALVVIAASHSVYFYIVNVVLAQVLSLRVLWIRQEKKPHSTKPE